ncbi:MAG TPA: hypothetical protein VGG35_25585 [Streptosporangiaceae bacterium]
MILQDTAGPLGGAHVGPGHGERLHRGIVNAAGCELGEGQQIALAGPAQF